MSQIITKSRFLKIRLLPLNYSTLLRKENVHCYHVEILQEEKSELYIARYAVNKNMKPLYKIKELLITTDSTHVNTCRGTKF